MEKVLSMTLVTMMLLIIPFTSKAKAYRDPPWYRLAEVLEDFKTHYEKDVSGYNQQDICVHWLNTSYILSNFYRLRGDVIANLARNHERTSSAIDTAKKEGRDKHAEWGEMLLKQIEDTQRELWHITDYVNTRQNAVSIKSGEACLANH